MKEIKGIARVKFLPGKLEEWKRLTAEAMHIVRTKDKGTLQYDRPVLAMPPAKLRASVFNADESEALVFERYRDSDAALEHSPTSAT